MSCYSIGAITSGYGVFSVGGWTLSDQLQFALFSEIIANQQKAVYDRIENNTYNSIVYNIDNSDNSTTSITYNMYGQMEGSEGSGQGGSNGNGQNVGQNINVQV